MKDVQREFTTEQDFDCRQRSGVFADAKPVGLQIWEIPGDWADGAGDVRCRLGLGWGGRRKTDSSSVPVVAALAKVAATTDLRPAGVCKACTDL